MDHVPVVKHLLGNTGKSDSHTTLFVFLKPTILRDDKFRDLKFLSDRDLDDSCGPGNFPQSDVVFVD